MTHPGSIYSSRTWRARLALIAGGAVLGGAFLVPAAQAAAHRVWYVGAAAASGGDGSARAPFNSLAVVEQVAGPGDTIIINLGYS
jgi:hypothetical protein